VLFLFCFFCSLESVRPLIIPPPLYKFLCHYVIVTKQTHKYDINNYTDLLEITVFMGLLDLHEAVFERERNLIGWCHTMHLFSDVTSCVLQWPHVLSLDDSPSQGQSVTFLWERCASAWKRQSIPPAVATCSWEERHLVAQRENSVCVSVEKE